MADLIVTAGEADRTPPELLAPPDMPMPGWFRTPEGLWERIPLPPQRIAWPRFEPAPEDMPHPFWQPWWGQMQVLGWIYCRNPDVVRDVAPPEPFESTLTRKGLRDLGRNSACYPRPEDAEKAEIEALQAGWLTAYGVANGDGDRKEIPSPLWADLKLDEEDPSSARPKDLLRKGATCWYFLRFQRKQVLAVWPDSKGNANVEPRTHNTSEILPPDLAKKLADKRWGKHKQKREGALGEAEAVARERWKKCDDDHAKMTSWLQNEYSPDNKETFPFADATLTEPLLKRMAKVAREIGKRVRGEKKSHG